MLGILSGAASLDADTKDVDGYVPWSLLNALADTTRDALTVFEARLQLPLTDEQAAAYTNWGTAVEASVGAIGRTMRRGGRWAAG